MADELVIDVTDETFESEVINANRPVLVDFWAKWCGPCKALAPTISQIAFESQEKLKVVKVDVDANRVILNKLGIRGIPALYFYKDGKVVDSVIGFVPKETIEKFVKQVTT